MYRSGSHKNTLDHHSKNRLSALGSKMQVLNLSITLGPSVTLHVALCHVSVPDSFL